MKRFLPEILILFLFLLVIAVQWILFRAETPSSSEISASVFITGSGNSETAAPLNVVDINTASSDDLCMLPGIGPVTAERIVSYRTENGLFQTAEDIKAVSGIGEETYLQIENFITVR